MNDYSQHGEGKIISEYFKGEKGVLISLGENDGKTLSNVLHLIEDGWKGYLVEPSDVFQKLTEQHKGNENVKCFNYGIGTYDGESFFYESGEHLGKGDQALLSSISESEIKRWGNTCTFKKVVIKLKTWESFKKDAGFRKADLISIDCEGVDYDILTQIDFNKLKTRMVIVESNSVENQKYIDHMAKFGFKLHFSNLCNLIFTK